MIRLALEKLPPERVESAHSIVAACGRALHEKHGLAHWHPPLSVEEMRAQAVERDVLLAFFAPRAAADAAVATLTVGPTSLADYETAIFGPAARPLYLNRLAVVPALQGRGTGAACVAAVEELGRARGCDAVRLDAIARHEALLAFYRRLGYVERGPSRNHGWDVVCFDKRLHP